MAAAATVVRSSTPTTARSGRRCGQLGHLGGRGVGVGEVEREEMIGRVHLERARLLGGADDVDAERARGVEEILGAIRRRRQEQEQPVHGDALPDDASG